MAEHLYTIPVNDAFDADTECPLCKMYNDLEKASIEFTMGPSYMEDDNREVTDEKGFCFKHMKQLYEFQNRLGLALIQNTHMNKQIKALANVAKKDSDSGFGKSGLMGRRKDQSPVVKYIQDLNSKCFVCERIDPLLKRYVSTIFHMWKKDSEFQEKFKKSKGFCINHYGLLYEEAGSDLNQKQYAEFITALNQVFFDGMNRVNEDVSWFIDKHDYRNKDADWKNAKDSVARMAMKANGVIIEDK